ncbi:hypothetical protein Ancab_020607 [Ancistrocladus abbreviatus]
MGESVVNAPKVESKMGESATNVGTLQVSVSFGRFENDSLCWEKWSTFPTNKYLEEVEKCSTPGSVAQKKAYFEAHYKKIAARKAEQLEPEKKKDTDPVGLKDQSRRDSANDANIEDLDLEKSNYQSSVSGGELENEEANVTSEITDSKQNSVNGIELVNEVTNVTSEMSDTVTQNSVSGVELDNESTNLTSDGSSTVIDEPNNDADTNEDGNLLPPAVDAKDELCSEMDHPKLDKSEEAVSVKVDAPSVGSEAAGEVTKNIHSGQGNIPQDSEKKVKSSGLKKPQKVTTVKKATNITSAKKKPASPTPRSPLISTPKQSKPSLSRTVMSATRLSATKENGLTPLSVRKTARAAESKRAAPTALHMSFSLDPPNSDPGPIAITRKSLIMERMGDKDIVKRAFKTFRNDFSQLSSSTLGKASETVQFSRSEGERKSLISGTPPKKNEGTNKAVKTSAPNGQHGTRKTSFSPGLLKTGGMEQRNGTTLSSSLSVKSHDRADKQKGPEGKSNIKEAAGTHFQSKIKAVKELELKKLQHSMNLKGKPVPSFYRGSGVLKSSVHKLICGRKDWSKYVRDQRS